MQIFIYECKMCGYVSSEYVVTCPDCLGIMICKLIEDGGTMKKLTSELRLFSNGRKVALQQAWIDTITGETEWRSVPVVTENKPKKGREIKGIKKEIDKP